VEQVFLSGINHVFYHGTTYSPAEVPWPGWLFYASVNFVPANSMWPHLNGLNEYITRCQSVLQSGKPDNEILAYWPMYDVWSNPKGRDMALKVHDVDEWLHPTSFYKNLSRLQKQGYSMDFASDKMLSQAFVANGVLKVSQAGGEHKVLLISKSKVMPVATLQNIIRLARSGAVVVMEDLPEDVPGLQNLEARRKEFRSLIASIKVDKRNSDIGVAALGNGKIIIAKDVTKGLEHAAVRRERLGDSGLKFIRRSFQNGKYYYIVNHSAKIVDTLLPIQYLCSSVVLMDPQTGTTGAASFSQTKNETVVRLQLQPGEAMIIKAASGKNKPVAKWNYVESAGAPIILNDNWNISFASGGPQLPPAKKITGLQLWTNFSDDSTTQNFSGTAVYSTTVNLPAIKPDDYIMLLDEVRESARVFINGKEVALLWSIPYKARVGQYLKAGNNTISIEVTNLMANRIRYMDRNGLEWRKYHEINFVDINYKNFDASKWKVQPSGLGGPVSLIPVTYKSK
jgi:hypothetical protein